MVGLFGKQIREVKERIWPVRQLKCNIFLYRHLVSEVLAAAKAAVHQSDIYHQFFGRPLSPDFSNFFSHDSPILWQSCTHTWKEKLVLMPIRVVAVVFTTLQSAVLGTNYSSVAVKLLYVSIIPVFVSERFFKQERNF